MSLKLNLRESKKKKKSTKPPKTKDGKLAYQLGRINFAQNRLEDITRLDNDEQKKWKKQTELLNPKRKFKKTSQIHAQTPPVGKAPLLMLASNPAANDDLQPSSLDYVYDSTSLDLPVRTESLFVCCAKCKQPVCTAYANSIQRRAGKYYYQHKICPE